LSLLQHLVCALSRGSNPSLTNRGQERRCFVFERIAEHVAPPVAITDGLTTGGRYEVGGSGVLASAQIGMESHPKRPCAVDACDGVRFLSR